MHIPIPISRSLLLAVTFMGTVQTQTDELKDAFRAPPASARPGVYWYFMDGNLNRGEMVKDLESMAAAGLGSALFLEVDLGVPRGPVAFMSETWQDYVSHAFKAAERLGMEVILGTGPGWSGSGGSWVPPQDSMQHLVGSSTRIQGPARFAGELPVPPPHPANRFAKPDEKHAKIRDEWFQDVAVLAFPTPGDSISRLGDWEIKTLKDSLPTTMLRCSLAPEPHLVAHGQALPRLPHPLFQPDAARGGGRRYPLPHPRGGTDGLRFSGERPQRVAAGPRQTGIQSFFVVFTAQDSEKLTESGAAPKQRNFPDFEPMMKIDGPWQLAFDPKWGGPAKVEFDQLVDWSTHEDEGIRYYSGSATYRKVIEVPETRTRQSQTFLDLGTVHSICRVKPNGKDLGILWSPPWRVEVSGALRPGRNVLEIEVVNDWVNRLIGDQQPANAGVRTVTFKNGILGGQEFKAGRYTFTHQKFYEANSPLLPAGLLGPVRLMGWNHENR